MKTGANASGPGVPSEAGCMPEAADPTTRRYRSSAFWFSIRRLSKLRRLVSVRREKLHGKSLQHEHDGQAMFAGLANPLPVARVIIRWSAKMFLPG